MAERHKKCQNSGNCTGPGCRVTRDHYSTAAPRLRDRLTKGERKLATRVKTWEEHGRNPQAPNNPSNGHGTGYDMRRPGSQNFRNN